MIVLVRHGQTTLNAEGRLSGHLDVPLTDLGVAQAAAAARAVKAMGQPTRVICSPLQRARQTASALEASALEASALEVGVEVDDRWIELDYGEYDGRPTTEVPAETWRAWRLDSAFRPPGGESLDALDARVRPACDELAASGAADELVVVVTHVSPIKAAVAWALGVGIDVSWHMYVAPASIAVIGLGPGGPSLHAFNQTAHLEALFGG